MRIFITGAAGFIGSYLIEHHLKKGDLVYGIDDLSSSSGFNLVPFMDNPNFRLTNADIITWPDLEKISGWADRIYHLAAITGVEKVLKDPARVLSVNIAGCERLFRTVKKADWKPHVILLSNSEVYGPSTKDILSENDNLIIESRAKNRWHYAVSKLADESFALAYYRKFFVPITIIRLFNIIGPSQLRTDDVVVSRFVKQAINNKPLTVFGDGNQSRSFCDVRDAVKIFDLLANMDKTVGEIINVGNNQEVTINQLAKLIIKLANSKSIIQYISYEEAYGEDYVDIPHRRPNLNKLMSLTKYKYKWTLADSIKDMIAEKK